MPIITRAASSLTRHCGDCQLCCRLLPVNEVNKPGGTVCRYQKFKKGCTVYSTPKMPACCTLWNCRWLVNDDTADLPRPDRAHYVIDLMPDFVTHQNDVTGECINIQVVQIWIDPNHRDAYRDPALRSYMHRRAQEGTASIVRFNERDAIVIFPPPFDVDGEWHEIISTLRGPSHTFDQVEAALGSSARIIVTDD